jgi:membrane associated rhomboid family serine protease
MSALTDEFKNVWIKPNNALMQIIVINIIVFLVINLLYVGLAVSGVRDLYGAIAQFIYIPAPIEKFLWRPWTLITYFFTHQNPLHILFNMWVMYWFGLIVKDFLGDGKVIALYVLGGVAGGVIYLICFNTLPYFKALTPELGMLGASACVYAIVAAAATYKPHLEMNLLFFGNVKIVYIAVIVIFLSFIGIGASSSDAGAGGNLAHLGGALIGYIFIKQYERGRDWSMPIMQFLNMISSIWGQKATTRTGKKTKASTGKAGTNSKSKSYTSAATPSQDDIDAILDKISAYGYEGLTTEEKQILFKASQKK